MARVLAEIMQFEVTRESSGSRGMEERILVKQKAQGLREHFTYDIIGSLGLTLKVMGNNCMVLREREGVVIQRFLNQRFSMCSLENGINITRKHKMQILTSHRGLTRCEAEQSCFLISPASEPDSNYVWELLPQTDILAAGQEVLGRGKVECRKVSQEATARSRGETK